MDKLLLKGKVFESYEYALEKDFEEEIVKHSKVIFGENSIYIDVKKKISNENIVTIPDGYLIDFSFESDPQLYIIENELVKHDPYKHIGQQLLKFAISYKESGRKIKQFLLDHILKSEDKKEFVSASLKKAGYRNIDAFFEEIIFDKPVSAIVVIDEITSDLENVISQLSMRTDILEFQTYTDGKEQIHKFTPFQQDIISTTERKDSKIKIEDLDTIVVSARESGFKDTFLGENCWGTIRISSSMIDRIKYIAGYQTNPISAITHYAAVSRIEKNKDTNKYIIYFSGEAKKIDAIKLPVGSKGLAPQAPRYTTLEKLLKAKTMEDVF